MRDFVLPAGADDQCVERKRLAAPGVDDAPIDVDALDDRLSAELEAHLSIELFALQEQLIERLDLTCNGIGNTARAVGDILELGDQRDIQRAVGLNRHRGGAGTGAAAANNNHAFHLYSRPPCIPRLSWSSGCFMAGNAKRTQAHETIFFEI